MMFIAFCLVNAVASATADTCPHDYDVLAPCEYEDSADCYWDAANRGNGLGNSFVDIDGLLFSWDGKAN